MGPDPANWAGSIAKSLDVERSPRVRTLESSNSLKFERFKRERKRREIERRMASKQESETDSDGETGLDVMV